ncbi:hypothetical protein PR202_ga17622 [Eleusine coracana subsp. coracana]|uniref:Trichome birefringence-like N-terminal domain-containing protein n=1 Tax=Eleusine coracana subsp. coracana TaxID=191504 RepID=A0AAV5CQI4_ELECO|nr:hypothetical protein PR202_ga17375 [Eleusine coracana subsp. coracana]GJN00440.1 hypothetical protein PR202_ga17622 [Eleusine coracana subsp. coracana]
MVTNFLQKFQLQNNQLVLPKKQLVTYALYALLALALLHHLLFYPAPAPEKAVVVPRVQDDVATVVSSQVDAPEQLPPPPPVGQKGDEVLVNPQAEAEVSAPPPPPCDFSDGEWVPDARPPLYNGTSCGTIKDGQNCMAHGRPDTSYLYWRWHPKGCDLPPFSPDALLRWLRNKHLAFVGDSLARNQAESLMCLLASRSPPELVHRDGEENKRRRWVFRSHNATVSVFWSPFLVNATEKAERAGVRHNNVFLDAFDERWMARVREIDAVVLAVGHWFLIPGVYHDGGVVVACHDCADLNRTETGDWDKSGACPKKRPYRSGEKELGYTETEMRKTVVEAVAQANAGVGAGSGLRFAALDVTTLANLRPDGHPGPYMHKDPFAGAGDRVQNDCVHWCMPGPVDTFNEILLQTILLR